jgi:uncharacterized membrane protein YedE/YeeE
VEDFTPLSGLVGGLLIGLAVSMLLLLNGRLAGISGIVGGLLSPARPGTAWRWTFLAGLVLGSSGFVLLSGGPVPVELKSSLPVLVVAGLLVGFGTRLGSGCTSGHGLCGLSRLSKRSVAATAVFFGVAMLTVLLVRHAV